MTTKKQETTKLKTITLKHGTGDKYTETDYVPVNERIKHFRENYTGHTLETEVIHLDESWVCLRAVIRRDGDIIADGIAYEKANSTYINKTSYIENCQTSAWGRALGCLGIGIENEIRTAEEIANALKNQPRATTQQLNHIKSLIDNADISDSHRQEIWDNMDAFTQDRATSCIEFLNDTQDRGDVKTAGTAKKLTEKAVENKE